MPISKDSPKIGSHPSASILSNQPAKPKQEEKTAALFQKTKDLFQRASFDLKREVDKDADPKIKAKKEQVATKLDNAVKQQLNRL